MPPLLPHCLPCLCMGKAATYMFQILVYPNEIPIKLSLGGTCARESQAMAKTRLSDTGTVSRIPVG